MARDWKKAHDQEQAARRALAADHDNLKASFEMAMQVRISMEDRIKKALTLALGAAENLEAQGKSASATAIRNAVDVLDPNVSRSK